MKKGLVVVFMLISLFSYAQNRNSIWCFGDSAGIDFRDTANPVPIFSGMDGRGTCASIADVNGNLLFYAQTGRGGGPNYGQVLNKNHNIMQNGNGIKGDAWYNEMTIIPKPNDSNLYYLISTPVTLYKGIYYSIIDISQNSGLGSVTQKNIVIDSSDYYYDAMTAVKHGNGKDW